MTNGNTAPSDINSRRDILRSGSGTQPYEPNGVNCSNKTASCSPIPSSSP